MAQGTIPLTRLMNGMAAIGLDRLELLPPFIPQRFIIPSEIEACCLPLTSLDVIQVSDGGRTIPVVQHAVRAVVDVAKVLSQVSP